MRCYFDIVADAEKHAKRCKSRQKQMLQKKNKTSSDAVNLRDSSDKHGSGKSISLSPLADLVNYSSVLRTLSSGTDTLSVTFRSYKRITESEKRMAAEKVTAFAH